MLQCNGLDPRPEPQSGEACKAECLERLQCEVYQWMEEGLVRCWSGKATTCTQGSTVLDGGRKVRDHFIGWVEATAQCSNLNADTMAASQSRCLQNCEVDDDCEVYQWMSDGFC